MWHILIVLLPRHGWMTLTVKVQVKGRCMHHTLSCESSFVPNMHRIQSELQALQSGGVMWDGWTDRRKGGMPITPPTTSLCGRYNDPLSLGKEVYRPKNFRTKMPHSSCMLYAYYIVSHGVLLRYQSWFIPPLSPRGDVTLSQGLFEYLFANDRDQYYDHQNAASTYSHQPACI